MARILYGIQGDRSGHVNRALSVAGLLPGHEFLFVGGGAAEKAREAGYAFERLPYMRVEIRDNSVRALPTFAGFIRNRLEQGGWLKRLCEIITAFDPHLILTDCEYYTPRAALRLGRPCYSLDHQHVLSRSRYTTGPGQAFSRMVALAFQRMFIPGVQGSLIVSFHRPPLVRPGRDAIFGTVPRPDVFSARAEAGDHVLLYLPDCDPVKIEALFGGRGREYRVYGLGKAASRGAISFRAPSREGFLEDIASAAYVVSCGGHGTLTEALHFGKASLCFPAHFDYEQYWNSYFVQEKGLGRFFTSMTVDRREVDAFESRLPEYAANIAAGDFGGGDALRGKLHAMLGGGGEPALQVRT